MTLCRERAAPAAGEVAGANPAPARARPRIPLRRPGGGPHRLRGRRARRVGRANAARPPDAGKDAAVGVVTLRGCPRPGARGRAPASALLAVLHAADEAAEVLLDDPVAREPALPARGDEAVAAQDPELLRDDRLARPHLLGERGDVLLAAAEDRDDPDPERVRDRLQHLGHVPGAVRIARDGGLGTPR